MNTLRFLTVLSMFVICCNQANDNTKRNRSNACACIASDDSTSAATYKTVRGALLGTRFASLEELKSVIQIEYDDGRVRVRHCSNGKKVMAVLETGASQGDLEKAAYGTIWDRLKLLFRCPYAVVNRKDLESAYILSRWKSQWFGEGDVAFFDMAKLCAENINTPELAFRNSRDSTEKGYLNSFNHIASQAFITSCFSEELADFIADAHERHHHPELITGKFTEAQIIDLGDGPVDNYVDLVNNKWGQELGKQLKKKYAISRETNWTPELLANYLNDLQGYYSWAFQIGFEPFRPEDQKVLRFSKKIDTIMKGQINLKE